tara:strand:- start:816 stop:1208 length:393 start_codon:yes stop_codon:yes gene_type:complete
MNTQFNLLYKDINNTKASVTVILAGAITDAQIDAIMDKLDDGMYFIPNQVGLPAPADTLAEHADFPHPEQDHAWTIIKAFHHGDKPTADSMLTQDAPTHSMTIDELVSRIVQVEWDEDAEWERLTALTGQ